MKDLPLLHYLYKIFHEHTVPMEDMPANLVLADWILDAIVQTEAVYRRHGTIGPTARGLDK